jgi:hypothetical protein
LVVAQRYSATQPTTTPAVAHAHGRLTAHGCGSGPRALADVGCALTRRPERPMRRCARQGIGRCAGARERRDRGWPHRQRSLVRKNGEQEQRRLRGEKAAALGPAYRQEERAVISWTVRQRLWTGAHPDSAAALRLETVMTCVGRRRRGEWWRQRGEKAVALGPAYQQEELAAISRTVRQRLRIGARPDSVAVLRLETMTTCTGRRRRGEQRRQRGEKTAALGSTARTSSGGVRCSDMRPQARQRSALDRGCRKTRAPPSRPANHGVASGDRVADWWVPHISPFSILKNIFLHKKNRYIVRKHLTKFLKVGNQIWNTFHH